MKLKQYINQWFQNASLSVNLSVILLYIAT